VLILSITKGKALRQTLHVCPLPPILTVSLLNQLSPSIIIPRREDSRLLTCSPNRQCDHMSAQAVEACLITNRVLTTVCHLASCRAWLLFPIVQMGHSASLTLLSETDIPTPQSKWRT
jgi:hypothetical protein